MAVNSIKENYQRLREDEKLLKLSEIPIMHLHFAPAGFILINLIQIKVDFCRHVIIVFLSVGICSNPQSEVFLVQKGRIFFVLTICQKTKVIA